MSLSYARIKDGRATLLCQLKLAYLDKLVHVSLSWFLKSNKQLHFSWLTLNFSMSDSILMFNHIYWSSNKSLVKTSGIMEISLNYSHLLPVSPPPPEHYPLTNLMHARVNLRLHLAASSLSWKVSLLSQSRMTLLPGSFPQTVAASPTFYCKEKERQALKEHKKEKYKGKRRKTGGDKVLRRYSARGKGGHSRSLQNQPCHFFLTFSS